MTYKIGILKHDYLQHAEKQIILKGKEKGLEVILIDPFTVTMGVSPDVVRNGKDLLHLDGVISRCEISSCLAPEAEAYLRLLQFFEIRNVPIINSSQSLVACQDKFRTHYLLSAKGVSTPKTFVTYEYESAEKILMDKELQFPVIIKKVYGSRGDGVYKISNFNELKFLCLQLSAQKEVFFLQEFLDLETNEEGQVKDLRIWAVRDKKAKPKVFGAVYRNARNGDFRTNVKCAGYVTKVENLTQDIIEISKSALDAVSADVAGIDLARTKDGKLYVQEINISFDTGSKTQEYIGEIWREVLELLISRIEMKPKLHQ